jgi:Arc/MetJ-type ribon-helix-helix transcriptional regulator
MAQFVTRIDDGLADAVDRLVEEGVVASRSAAVRIALERLIDRHQRHRTGQAIAEGYTSRPQTDADVGWADEATKQMIREEPW